MFPGKDGRANRSAEAVEAGPYFCPCCGYRGLHQPAYTELPPPPFEDLGDTPYVARFGGTTLECCDLQWVGVKCEEVEGLFTRSKPALEAPPTMIE
jgi:hypothetical protein